MHGDSEQQYISTAQAARALGVSISTVKRWVDEEVLPAHRTPGGHRKLLRAEVLTLARSGDLPRSDLAELVLPGKSKTPVDAGGIVPLLAAAVLRGDGAETRALIQRAYWSGMPIEELADRVIAPVMEKVGDDWETGCIDVWHEHRSLQVIAAAIYELLPEIERRTERARPVALGAAPEGDPYLLPTLLAQMVLLDAGWEAINLGPNTPLGSLFNSMRQLQPKLIWVSVSYLADGQRFIDEYRRFAAAAQRSGIPIAVGGQALGEEIRSQIPYTTYGDGLSHLANFARALHPRPRRPAAGGRRSSGSEAAPRFWESDPVSRRFVRSVNLMTLLTKRRETVAAWR
jgi:MerR family transcriptional regulator, light-induced transcriptional regulator